MKKFLITFVLIGAFFTSQAQTGVELGVTRHEAGETEKFGGYAAFGLDLGPGMFIIEPIASIQTDGPDANDDFEIGLGGKLGINLDNKLSLYLKGIKTNIAKGEIEKEFSSINSFDQEDTFFGGGLSINNIKSNIAVFAEYLRDKTGRSNINAGFRINFRSTNKKKNQTNED